MRRACSASRAKTFGLSRPIRARTFHPGVYTPGLHPLAVAPGRLGYLNAAPLGHGRSGHSMPQRRHSRWRGRDRRADWLLCCHPGPGRTAAVDLVAGAWRRRLSLGRWGSVAARFPESVTSIAISSDPGDKNCSSPPPVVAEGQLRSYLDLVRTTVWSVACPSRIVTLTISSS